MWPLALMVVLGGGVLLSASKSKASAKGSTSPASSPVTVIDEISEIEPLLLAASLDAGWRRFFTVIARKESGFVSNVFLGRVDRQPPGTVLSKQADTLGEGEWRAAQTAYERLTFLHACYWPAARYEVAGGLFGQLAPLAVAQWAKTPLACLDPWSIFDPVEALVMAIGNAGGLTRRADFDVHGDWLDVFVGWGSPASIGDPERRALVAGRLAKHLAALGIADAWLYQRVTALPVEPLLELRERLLAQYTSPGGMPSGADAEPAARTYTAAGFQVLEFVTAGARLDDVGLPVVVGLHGRGGSPSAFAEVVRQTNEPIRFVVPTGPVEVGGGRAWWPETTAGAAGPVLADRVDTMVDRIAPLLLEVEARHGRRPIVLGHSQGGILAYGIAARAGSLADVVIAASGWLPRESIPDGDGQTIAWPEVVIGVHGSGDETVPIDYAIDTLTALEFAGANVDVVEIDGGHGLAGMWPVLRDLLIAWGGYSG
jgi:predicted esterase